MSALGKISVIVTFYMLFISMVIAHAQDAGIPDTVRIEDAVGSFDYEYPLPFAVSVSVFNDNDLNSIIIPLLVDGYSGWARFDSVSYQGSRLSDPTVLDIREVSSFGTDLRTVDSLILQFEVGSGNALTTGDGKICDLWFRPNYGGGVSIDSLHDSPYGSLALSTSGGSFIPQFQEGMLDISCAYMIGDTRPDGAINGSDLLGLYKGYLGCFGFDFTDPWHADVNCDRYTDLRDVVNLYDYIFQDSSDILCSCGSYNAPIYNDPGKPDTVWTASDILYVGKQDTISVGIINDDTLRGFAFAIEWDGDVILEYTGEIINAPRLSSNVFLNYYECNRDDMVNPDTMYAATWSYSEFNIPPGREAVLSFVVIPQSAGSLSFRFVNYYAYAESVAIGAESMLVTENKEAILPVLAGGNIVVEPYLCGDSNSDGLVNVSDVIWIVNYVFVGGDPPLPYESGDANCDSVVSISDAVYIINYIFVGGNVPCFDC